MKKIVLTLGLLFAAGASSAQTYAAQPDPTIVNVVYYQKPAEEAKEAPAETTEEPKQENAKEAATDKKQENYAATPKEAVNKKERLAVNANKPKAEED